MKTRKIKTDPILASLLQAQQGAKIELTIESLLARKAPYNPREIDAASMAKLRTSLREFGVADPVCVNIRTGNVVGGHQRIEAAKAEGWTHFPVWLVDLPLAREAALNVALNNPSMQGRYLDAGLAAVFDMISAGGEDPGLTGFVEAERRVIADGWATDFAAVERIAPHTDGLIATIVVEAPTESKEQVRTAIFDLLQGLGVEGARVR